eukprot:gi/632953632/ref/XP_007892530.1/ PREDICTED: cystatin-F isoform X1 [Callorhinchus milii]
MTPTSVCVCVRNQSESSYVFRKYNSQTNEKQKSVISSDSECDRLSNHTQSGTLQHRMDRILVTPILFAFGFISFTGIQSQPGHPINIVNITNNEGIQNATRFAMSAYNNQTNDIFVFKVKRFNNATVQVVKGYKYVVEAVIGRTTCRKGKPFNFKDCPFQPKPPLNREFVCYYTVWSIPWEKKWILLSLKCQ